MAGKVIVSIDPDGTEPAALFVVVLANTGIFYHQQCGGVACDQRFCEGYLVPVCAMGDQGPVNPCDFVGPFHRGNACFWNTAALPEDRLTLLSELIRKVRFWPSAHRDDLDFGTARPVALELDAGRVTELCEAWIPVVTPDGPGILITPNCD